MKQNVTLSLTLFGSLLGATSRAEIKELSPVRASTEMQEWNESIRVTATAKEADKTLSTTGYTECAETKEIPGAFLCGSYQQNDMNLALTRASIFIEGLGNHPAGTVVRRNDPTYRSYLSQIGGHDLKAADLMRFYNAALKACADSNSDPEVCFNLRETEIFSKFIIPHAKSNPEFVLITWASLSRMGYTEVVTHEIMHAQYFLDEGFRKVVDEFWAKDVPAADQANVKRQLQAIGYGVEGNDLLLKNEFQAYVLMAGAQSSQLPQYAAKYREKLLTKLRQAGVEAVQVQ